MCASTGPISVGTEGPDAAMEDELSETQLEQISGGVSVGSPSAAKLRRPTTQWSGTPYSTEDDVEAY
jgi:bacteriocin-like protein